MNPFIRIITLLLLASVFSCQSEVSQTGEKPDNGKVIINETAEKIDALLSSYHDSSKYNGTILVADQGELIYKAAFGVASVEKEFPMAPESQFYLASVAKQMTCMGIMILENEGKLDFDDKIRIFFPDLPSWADKVSVRNMMNHTSGIPDYYEMDVPRPGFTNDDVYQALLDVEKLDFPVASAYSYSNSAYVLLSMIIIEVSGQSYGEFMQKKIFEPLGMTNTLVYDQQTPEMPTRAIGYTKTFEIDDYQYFTTGGGGIFSNVEDVFKWDQALYTDQLIPNGKIQDAYQPATLTNDSLSYYGFGWRLDKDAPNLVQHSGSLNGFRTYIIRQLDTQTTIILLTNHTNTWLSDILNDIGKIIEN